MNRTNSRSRLWLIITVVLAATVSGSMASWRTVQKGSPVSLSKEEVLRSIRLVDEEADVFPFKIQGSRFVRKSDNKPVFLNIIGYQPIEPEHDVNSEISEERIRDDLRRWQEYQDGTDPIVIRVYPGPLKNDPNRVMPKVFYDGLRELGFWVIRDIYFEPNCADPYAGKQAEPIIDAVLAEVNDANAFDRIFAWEIGDELEAPYDGNETEIKEFVEGVCVYLKKRLRELNVVGDSNWVTWASWAANDPLHTAGAPIEPNCLDYISYNAYSYDPERMRDHQAGPITGTPYQGYLAALKERYPDKPLVISESGLTDNNNPEDIGDHRRMHPWYPTYRKGGLTSDQVAEGLADRYWDARLLRGQSDPNIVMAGFAVFEWNDEWWKYKGGSNANQENKPEEHFGLARFVERPGAEGYQLRYKLQQETIRDLYTLKFTNDPAMMNTGAENTNICVRGEPIKISAEAPEKIQESMRYRWEANRGRIVGDGSSVDFYPASNVLGPARITTVSIDSDGSATVSSMKVNIEASEPNRIEILTFGRGVDMNDPKMRSSGRVYNADLSKCKLVCYLRDWEGILVAKPSFDMKSIWINADGYWWAPSYRGPNDALFCWLVDKNWPQPNKILPGESLPEYIAEANTVTMDSNDYNDVDNDLLPDRWERRYFGNIVANDRYSDQDKDGADNLEEFLAHTSPVDSNDPNGNDTDSDGLLDNWEYRFFGGLTTYGPNDDPDGDGLINIKEHEPNLGTHPGRTSPDRDQDKLPDLWEIRWFGSIDANAQDNPDDDCFNNLEEYELGLDPTSCMGDINRSGTVDLLDYSAFALHWQSDCNGLDSCIKADLDKSGIVDWVDLSVLIRNWLLEL